MTEMLEFFVPNQPSELDDPACEDNSRYHVNMVCDFDVPMTQQLDDLTRLFDSLHREKSPTALFSKTELFYPLFSYIKAIYDKEKGAEVTRATRHKICHEIGERMKKLLQVAIAFLKRKDVSQSSTDALKMCLRSTLKMYTFCLCHVLMAVAPSSDDESGVEFSQQQSGNRRRKRRAIDSGFGGDDSGVDMDGRELVLTSLMELCSPEVVELWPNGLLEDATLNLILRMTLRMITQKSNIGADAQSIAGALALLLARVSSCMTSKSAALESIDLVSPLVELALKSDCAALFLSKFVADMEQEESGSVHGEIMLKTLFESMASAALYESSGDAMAAKNIAAFLGEVSKRSVSVTVKFADLILPAIQSENYDIRKAVVTSIAEMVIQRYTGHSRSPVDDALRNSYLKELLFRVMDVNPFVRNHTLHTWERLVEAKAVPKRYHLSLTEALVGRLEDKNYLVRDAAMAVISSVLRKNWFGHVLSSALVGEKLKESRTDAHRIFESTEAMEKMLSKARAQFRPVGEETEDAVLPENGVEELEEGAAPAEVQPGADAAHPGDEMTDEQATAVNRVLFYECTLVFIDLIRKSLGYACVLLDSKTERDVVESIKLIVVCSEYHMEGAEKAFRKVLVMVFEGELKIQLAVRDAFVEVVFTTFTRISSSAVTRTTASAQKLIVILRDATEGEVSAVERIFSLLKLNPAYSRHISGQFIEAIWGIAEGTVDEEAGADDRRTAMRIYSLISKFSWKDLRTRKESMLEFLNSDSQKDNFLLSYSFTALQNEALDPQFRPIPSSASPIEHPMLKHLIIHLCRRTSAIASWMCLAESAVNAIHHLCEVPAAIYNYILDYLGSVVDAKSDDEGARAQLFFLVGHTALKQLVAVEFAERQQLKALEEPSKGEKNEGQPADSMHKELGLGSHEYKRHSIQELAQKRRVAIMAEGSLWQRFASRVVEACAPLKYAARRHGQRNDFPAEAHNTDESIERVCAVMALCKLMIVSETFCSENLKLLFTIVADKRESWVVTTNIVIALGDLACVHPNLLNPYLSDPAAGFFRLLVHDDLRVRAVTIQVCSHLVLGEMLRIRDHLHIIVKLVADPDETIANNAVTFVQNLAMKEKEKTGNFIPPLVTQLSGVMPSDKFQLAMRSLLERVEGDKPTDSLIERLCQRFDAYSERSKKKQQLAENIAFCLSELSYVTERAVKRIMSESCYQQYKHWLRNPEVLECFKVVAVKMKKLGRSTAERRDRTVIEEWEARMVADSNTTRNERKDGAAENASEADE